MTWPPTIGEVWGEDCSLVFAPHDDEGRAIADAALAENGWDTKVDPPAAVAVFYAPVDGCDGGVQCGVAGECGCDPFPPAECMCAARCGADHPQATPAWEAEP